jgi:hypothetical protein
MMHPLEEGTYFCDCTTSKEDVAGLFCEYQAETYCQLEQETSSVWFCVNKGTCVLATSGAAQYRCDCPPEYEGPVSTDTHLMIFETTKQNLCFLGLTYFLLRYCRVVLSIL